MDSALYLVCRREEVRDPGAREFEIRVDNTPMAGFILHWQGQWYAYRNSCPHAGVTLNWMPDRFFDLACEFIQCGLHGALFRPEDGLCVYGPCVGRSLERLPLVIDGAEIYIDGRSLSMG